MSLKEERIMRKFISSYSRQNIFVMEVEVEKISGIEDSSVIFLNPGEWKGRILKPESLYEKNIDPQGKPVPPTYCWWAFHNDIDSVMKNIRKSCELDFRKSKAKEAKLDLDQIEIDEEVMKLEVEKILSEVKVIYL